MKNKVEFFNTDKIIPDPNQPRKFIDGDHIKELAESIKKEGIINPIEIDENNTIITGGCRWRAAKLLGLKEVPIQRNLNKMTDYERLRRQMSENFHQSGADQNSFMSPIDAAKGLAGLLEMRGYKLPPGGNFHRRGRLGSGISQLQREIGKPDTTILEYLQLLEEPELVQIAIQRGTPRTYFREANKAPEPYKTEIKKKIASGEYTRRADIVRDVNLVRNDSEIEINLFKADKDSFDLIMKIFKEILDLVFAMKKCPYENLTDEQQKAMTKEFNWLFQEIMVYLGKVPHVKTELLN